MKPFLRSAIIGLVPAVILAGCATLPARVVENRPVAPTSLKLSIGYDLSFMRVDLKRATHLVQRYVMEADTKGVFKSEPEFFHVDNPYSYLVADLGNGLIVDANGNLSLDLLRFYHLNEANSYNVVERLNTLLPAGRTVVKNGSSFEVTGSGVVLQHLSATAAGGVMALRGDIWGRTTRIVRRANSISYEPTGRHSAGTVTIRQPSPEKVIFPLPGGQKNVFTLTGRTELRSTSGLVVTRRGNHLYIVLHAPGGIEASFTFVRTSNGCTITSNDGYGTIHVFRAGQKIYVARNGRLSATVTIRTPAE